MLVSGVRQSDSAAHIDVSILSQIFSPFRLLHNIVEFPVLYSRSRIKRIID